MTAFRKYRMTVATSWYDATDRGAKSYELHYSVARRGKIRTVRRTLSKRGLQYFQTSMYRRLRKWTPRGKIKVSFERELPAVRSERRIQIEGRSMLYRGKRWWAYPLPHRDLSYARKKRGRPKRGPQ